MLLLCTIPSASGLRHEPAETKKLREALGQKACAGNLKPLKPTLPRRLDPSALTPELSRLGRAADKFGLNELLGRR